MSNNYEFIQYFNAKPVIITQAISLFKKSIKLIPNIKKLNFYCKNNFGIKIKYFPKQNSADGNKIYNLQLVVPFLKKSNYFNQPLKHKFIINPNVAYINNPLTLLYKRIFQLNTNYIIPCINKGINYINSVNTQHRFSNYQISTLHTKPLTSTIKSLKDEWFDEQKQNQKDQCNMFNDKGVGLVDFLNTVKELINKKAIHKHHWYSSIINIFIHKKKEEKKIIDQEEYNFGTKSKFRLQKKEDDTIERQNLLFIKNTKNEYYILLSDEKDDLTALSVMTHNMCNVGLWYLGINDNYDYGCYESYNCQERLIANNNKNTPTFWQMCYGETISYGDDGNKDNDIINLQEINGLINNGWVTNSCFSYEIIEKIKIYHPFLRNREPVEENSHVYNEKITEYGILCGLGINPIQLIYIEKRFIYYISDYYITYDIGWYYNNFEMILTINLDAIYYIFKNIFLYYIKNTTKLKEKDIILIFDRSQITKTKTVLEKIKIYLKQILQIIKEFMGAISINITIGQIIITIGYDFFSKTFFINILRINNMITNLYVNIENIELENTITLGNHENIIYEEPIEINPNAIVDKVVGIDDIHHTQNTIINPENNILVTSEL
jgi:hypothetical protein